MICSTSQGIVHIKILSDCSGRFNYHMFMSWLPETQTILIHLNWFYLASICMTSLTCTWGYFTSGTSKHSQTWHDNQWTTWECPPWRFYTESVIACVYFMIDGQSFHIHPKRHYSSPLRNTHGHKFGVFSCFQNSLCSQYLWAAPSHVSKGIELCVQPNEKECHQICELVYVADFIA